MTTHDQRGQSGGSPVIPTLRYADAPKAIEWLCEAFGFEKKLVVPGEGDVILHAQLEFGTGMVMLGTAGVHGEFDEHVGSASGSGGVWSIYIVVPDADAAQARADRAGAEIVMPVEDQDYGGRGFGCLDPEGNMWSFGTYDPWDEE
ncbi:MAG: VOC family protein [Myxococcota bacterium]|nr:VOC family protein [Myxococcota bacterium]